MATVLTNAFISFATAGDLSGDSNQITLNYSAETLDDTVFGATTRTNTGGLKNWDAQVTILNNFAATEVDSKLFPLVGTTGVLAIRASAAVVGASNPQYSGGALLDSYQILGTSVGELPGVAITFKAAGALSRAVT